MKLQNIFCPYFLLMIGNLRICSRSFYCEWMTDTIADYLWKTASDLHYTLYFLMNEMKVSFLILSFMFWAEIFFHGLILVLCFFILLLFSFS